jgi:hypothetical protein
MWTGVWGMRNSEKRMRIVHDIVEKGIWERFIENKIVNSCPTTHRKSKNQKSEIEIY